MLKLEKNGRIALVKEDSKEHKNFLKFGFKLFSEKVKEVKEEKKKTRKTKIKKDN